MKLFLILLGSFPLFSTIANAQDSLVKKDNKIYYFGENSYLYRGETIGELKMMNVLSASGDKEVMRLARISNRSHNSQLIGFLAIPLVIATWGCLNKIKQNNAPPSPGAMYLQYVPPSHEAENKKLNAIAGTCLVLAVACPVASGVFKYRRMKYKRKAIELYDQKF